MSGSAEVSAWSLGTETDHVAARWDRWQSEDAPGRFHRADPTFWPAAAASDVESRMGWVDLPEAMASEVARLGEFADAVRAEGFVRAVVLGMGGSSLAPDVLRGTFPTRPGYLELEVLDSTHPEAVASLAARIDPGRTVFLVSSKSGTTTEPLAFYRYFWERVRASGADPRRSFAAVTDPGTPLEQLARDQGFRAVFLARPTVGGRYSALTMFGLVPAALLGIELSTLLERAATMARACGPDVRVRDNPGLALGAAIGELASRGRDKLTFYGAGGFRSFPVWAEQLVAESTGKIGRGIVPVAGEPFAPVEEYGPDRCFVEIQDDTDPDPILAAHTARLAAAGFPVLRFGIPDRRSVGAEFFRWEVAVASAGSILGIDPFDQPDVELAKELARQAMAAPRGASALSDEAAIPVGERTHLVRTLREWQGSCRTSDYVGIQAYLAPTPATSAKLLALRRRLLEKLHVATTVGYGPRFLHSTGQLHKGGPNSGLFLQLVDAPPHDLVVPGAGYSFGELIRAQALGDYRALRQKQRRVLRVEVGSPAPGGVQRITEALDG